MTPNGRLHSTHRPKSRVKWFSHPLGDEGISALSAWSKLQSYFVFGFLIVVAPSISSAILSAARLDWTWPRLYNVIRSLDWASEFRLLPRKLLESLVNIALAAFVHNVYYVLTPSRCATRPSSTISRHMPAAEIMGIIRAHGCPIVTRRLRSVNHLPTSIGGFGDIFEGRIDSNHTRVAFKCARGAPTSNEETCKALKDLARELHVWSKLDHVNVAALYGFAQANGRIGIVSPWMENGNIIQYLRAHNSANRHSLCAQIAEGLKYLHGQQVIHGDLKGANVLIDDDGTAKLTDFGNAVLPNASMRFTDTGTLCYSARWAAPEILEGKPRNFSTDSYALGMTILEVLTGRVPFHEKHLEMNVMRSVLVYELPRRPEELKGQENEDLWNVLLNCWSRIASCRKTADEVCATITARLSLSSNLSAA